MTRTRPTPGISKERTSLELSLLGGFELRRDGEAVLLPVGVQRPLAFVALHERPVARPYVAGNLWPETLEERALASLRCAIWKLPDLGRPLVEATRGHVRLAPGVTVDFREATTLARRLLVFSNEFEDYGDYERCLARDLLPDWYDEWAAGPRDRFRQLRLHALEALCERLTAAGRFAEAVEAALRVVTDEPLRETGHRALIEAHLAEGNAGEAIAEYRRYRRLLHDELGIEPSARIESLVAAIEVRNPRRLSA